ncbi:uncharacterized protein SPAPADRAFT_52646 [Spathaspora passalidarum NRRL Y-27907]|uniref:Uncharacterized protein n=1 Tax=Spathaspora passalidarum (strain NRRL Y-27907 / 11-Y1) TaxID=619300 RepID=G3AUL7_SPAPN|nr:uncharacterized protein SPAPADRAFT_52646 [Spathaspora passalidarum NRRL Y-27907]EGW30573.1 hypothetical protein SPAPADRAFT_52646 [Spathaspora passalidarum NRRL Y-27907]
MKLVTAIIHWLSEFPKSVVSADCNLSQFVTPFMIYNLFKFLFNEVDFNVPFEMSLDELFQLPYCELPYSFANQFNQVGSHNIISQIRILEMILANHFQNTLNNPDQIPDINLHRLILHQNATEITKYCKALVLIGTYTSKLSTVGLTTIEFLADEDKNMLEDIMAQRQRSYNKEIVPYFQSDIENRSNDAEVASSDQASNNGSAPDYIDQDDLKLLRWKVRLYEGVIYTLTMSKEPN